MEAGRTICPQCVSDVCEAEEMYGLDELEKAARQHKEGKE